jgi:hypothetical protein
LLPLAVSGCHKKAAQTKSATETPKPPEIRPLLDGSEKLRIQIGTFPNPPLVGAVAFDFWVTDPSKMLDPIPNAQIVLKAFPPKGVKSPPRRGTGKTGKDGKTTVSLGLTKPGQWTLKATASTAKNGKFTLTGKVPVYSAPWIKSDSAK